jgi:hypothetical protein
VALLPAELNRPFADREARARARAALVDLDNRLRGLELLAEKPPGEWSPDELGEFPSSTNDVFDPPPQRLARWASVFADELAEVHALARVSRPLGDLELRQALYVAKRLLATVYDRPVVEFEMEV